VGLFKQSKEMFQAATSPELAELCQRSKGMERPSMLEGIRQANELIEHSPPVAAFPCASTPRTRRC
jgi:hypothetical protein